MSDTIEMWLMSDTPVAIFILVAFALGLAIMT
jgi:hypothetical protein